MVQAILVTISKHIQRLLRTLRLYIISCKINNTLGMCWHLADRVVEIKQELAIEETCNLASESRVRRSGCIASHSRNTEVIDDKCKTLRILPSLGFSCERTRFSRVTLVTSRHTCAVVSRARGLAETTAIRFATEESTRKSS